MVAATKRIRPEPPLRSRHPCCADRRPSILSATRSGARRARGLPASPDNHRGRPPRRRAASHATVADFCRSTREPSNRQPPRVPRTESASLASRPEAAHARRATTATRCESERCGAERRAEPPTDRDASRRSACHPFGRTTTSEPMSASTLRPTTADKSLAETLESKELRGCRFPAHWPPPPGRLAPPEPAPEFPPVSRDATPADRNPSRPHDAESHRQTAGRRAS